MRAMTQAVRNDTSLSATDKWELIISTERDLIIMDEYVKCRFIEYKTFKRGRTYAKKGLDFAFGDGSLIICKDLGDAVRVVCIVKTEFIDPVRVVEDIKKIPLFSADEEYVFYYVGQFFVTAGFLERIRYVLNAFDKRERSSYRTLTFNSINLRKHIEYYLVANVTKGQEEAFCAAFEVSLVTKTTDDMDLDIEKMITGSSVNKEDTWLSQIKTWIDCTSYMSFFREIEKMVQGQPELNMVVFNVYQYLLNIAKGLPEDKQSIILAGPSGCGKTETYRALKRYFEKKIPTLVVDIVDINQITCEGFFGKNTKHLVEGLKNRGSQGIGIVFLDEFDKRLIPAYSGYGDNVNREIQGQLLMAIEGCMLDGVDTSKTLFIGMGSFNEVRERRGTAKHFGFGVDRSEKVAKHYDVVTREDMIELGASYELLGRFGLIVNYGALSSDAIDQIIDLRIHEISDSMGVKISVDEDMREHLHENANTEFGNRLIDSIIRSAVTRAKIEALTNEINAEEIVVTGPETFLFKGGVNR